MAGNRFTFRWWYLLILLPLLLYGGARWYVGHRIDQAIAWANGGENVLRVGDYSFGFFPLRLEVANVRFTQRLATLDANGQLSQATVSGLHLTSLIGDGPITVNELALRGLVADIERTAPPSDKLDNPYLLEAVRLDSIFLTVTDRVSGSEVALRDAALAMNRFHLPLQPQHIADLGASADTVRYSSLQDSTELLATSLSYAGERRAVTLQRLKVSRGTATDLRAERLTLVGVNTEDLANTFTLDSLTVGSLTGRARVPAKTTGEQVEAGGFPLSLGYLRLPQIDLAVTGAFGTAEYAGAIAASTLTMGGGGGSIATLNLSADTLSFENAEGLAVGGRHLELTQNDLRLPLDGGKQGATDVTLAWLSVARGPRVSGKLASLAYRSQEGKLTTGPVSLSIEETRGTLGQLTIEEFRRDSALAGGPLMAASATVTDADVLIDSPDGGNYRVAAAEVQLTDLRKDREFSIGRVQLAEGTVERTGDDGKLDVIALGVYVDHYGLRSPIEPARLGPVKVRARSVEIRSSAEPIDYRFTALAYDSRAGLLTLDSLRRVNRYPSAEVFRREIAKSWLSFHFHELRLRGIDHGAIMRGEAVRADSLLARDFQLMVVEDISLSVPSQSKSMPIEALRKIGMPIVLNGARFPSTDIAYGVVDTVLRPKTIHFTDGEVRLSKLDTEVSATDTVELSITSTFEQTAMLSAYFGLARDSSGRNFSARGELSSYDLTGINPLMEVAADAVVETGFIDGMKYASRMQDNVVTGDMRLLYHDLGIELVGGGAWIKNLLSGAVLKESNAAGEDFRPGKMYHEHPSDKSFFNAYWKGLLSGMKSTALSDLILPEELD